MAESAKFPRISGNRGRGTPSGVRDINLQSEAINSVLRMRCACTIYRSPITLLLFHATIIRTARSLWTWLWGRYQVPQNVFLVDNAIDEWRGRLRACVRAKGGHFEQML